MDSIDYRWAMIAMLAVAAWKIRLVMTDFVELRDASLAGRLVFEGWAVVAISGGAGRPALVINHRMWLRAMSVCGDGRYQLTEHRFEKLLDIGAGVPWR